MDKKADISTATRGDSIDLMEPMLISQGSRHRTDLTDLAIELATRSTGFKRSLPEGLSKGIANLVRTMNCYFSNLIEGHNTHPIDIERALKNNYSDEPEKRDLQLEAKAYISAQQWIDEGGLKKPLTIDGIREIHRRFGDLLPEEMLMVEEPETGERIRMAPGEFRARDVKIGRHIPISPDLLNKFLTRYEQVYSELGRTETILAAAAAHHRLLWIHPFLDGNGRVARLLSHAIFLRALDTGGLWSISRGLARNEQSYKSHLMKCDLKRRNDLDGRGHLSEEALIEFTGFFLNTCLDQVSFMEKLLQTERLKERILVWAREATLSKDIPHNSEIIFNALLYQGELRRAEIASLLNVSDRHARRMTKALLETEALTTEGPRSPLRLGFPAKLAARWMPGLFPE